MASPDWLKDFPDRDSAGYPCRVVYPTKEQMDSISVMCTGPALTLEEIVKAVQPQLKALHKAVKHGKTKRR